MIFFLVFRFIVARKTSFKMENKFVKIKIDIFGCKDANELSVRKDWSIFQLKKYLEDKYIPEYPKGKLQLFAAKSNFKRCEDSDLVKEGEKYNAHGLSEIFLYGSDCHKKVFPDLYLYDISLVSVLEIEQTYNDYRNPQPITRVMKLCLVKILKVAKEGDINYVIVKFQRPMRIGRNEYDLPPGNIYGDVFAKLWLTNKPPFKLKGIFQFHKLIEYDLISGIFELKKTSQEEMDFGDYQFYEPQECSICMDNEATMYMECDDPHLSCCENCADKIDQCPICTKEVTCMKKVVFLQDLILS